MTGSAIVVGASSGIGAALARQLAVEEGRPVALLARRLELLEPIAEEIQAGGGRALAIRHDVEQGEEVPALFERCEQELGSCDLLVYAAGVLPQEETVESMRRTVRVGLEGAVAWLHEAAEKFGERGRGTICGISSIAGDRGRTAFPAYHAAKAGLSTILESLHYRLFEKGIAVVTIKPGFIDTEMTKGMDGLFWLITPERAAEVIRKKIAVKARVAYVPWRWGLVSLVVRCIPAFLMRRMNF